MWKWAVSTEKFLRYAYYKQAKKFCAPLCVCWLRQSEFDSLVTITRLTRRKERKSRFWTCKFMPKCVLVYAWSWGVPKYIPSINSVVELTVANSASENTTLLAWYFQIPGWGTWSRCYFPALPSSLPTHCLHEMTDCCQCHWLVNTGVSIDGTVACQQVVQHFHGPPVAYT